MNLLFHICIFIISLTCLIIASLLLVKCLERIGTKLNISSGLLGMMIALGSDSPEISSAFAAIIRGSHDLGIGIVVGSNIYNIAALMGLSALIVKRLRIRSEGLIYHGIVAIVITAIATLLLFNIISPFSCLILILTVLIPYVIISDLGKKYITHLKIPVRLRKFFIVAIAHVHHASKSRRKAHVNILLNELFLIFYMVTIIIASFALVHSTSVIGADIGINDMILGAVIIAVLTSIPNTTSAIKLAKDGYHITIISEALNSNTINILFGICIPSLLLGLGSITAQALFSIWYLFGYTIITLILILIEKELSRRSGLFIILLYFIFIGIILAWK